MGRSLVYNTAKITDWATNVRNILGNDKTNVNTFGSCRNRLMGYLNDLKDPNVWRGPAAYQNLKEYKEMLDSFITFTNKFGTAFDGITHALGSTISVCQGLILTEEEQTQLTENLEQSDDQNIDIDKVVYDYTKMSEIFNGLTEVQKNMFNAKQNLLDEINKLNNGSGLWDGNVAYTAKIKLTSEVEFRYADFIKKLDVVLNNIKAASDNARKTDN